MLETVNGDQIEFDAASSMIEAKGLSKYFGPCVAVNNISFAIPEGQVVAFFGPNGSCQSSMMRMLTVNS